MDFIDPKKKQAHQTRLFVGYGLMAVVLTLFTYFLLLRVNGYGYDRKTGEVIQNGLLFADAHPETAEVYLNGELKGRTSDRYDIPAGDYTMELRRDKYRSWKRTLNLAGGSIERMTYPILFPEKLITQDVKLYESTPTFATESPEHRWVIVQQPGQLTTFDVMDINAAVPVLTTISLASDVLTVAGASHKLEIVEWSSDMRHLLIKHAFDAGTEFIVMDREVPGLSLNLNRHFGKGIAQISFKDKKFDQFYLIDIASELASADSRSKLITPIASQVITFKSHGNDTILFVTSLGANPGKVTVKIRSGNDQYILRELPTGPAYALDIARFEGAWYMVVGTNAEKSVYVYKNPLSSLQRKDSRAPLPLALLRLDVAVESVSFSANARFMAVQGGGKFVVYDNEKFRQYRYDTNLVISPGQKAVWMDGHRLTLVSEMMLYVFDYDGINKQSLIKVNQDNSQFFNKDSNALFTVSPSITTPGKFALSRTDLKLK